MLALGLAVFGVFVRPGQNEVAAGQQSGGIRDVTKAPPGLMLYGRDNGIRVEDAAIYHEDLTSRIRSGENVNHAVSVGDGKALVGNNEGLSWDDNGRIVDGRNGEIFRQLDKGMRGVSTDELGWSASVICNLDFKKMGHPVILDHLSHQPSPFRIHKSRSVQQGCFSRTIAYYRLNDQDCARDNSHDNEQPIGLLEGCVKTWRVIVGCLCLFGGVAIMLADRFRYSLLLGAVLFIGGCLIWLGGERESCETCGNCEYSQSFQHNSVIVPQKTIDYI
jgi:hypothetical protein